MQKSNSGPSKSSNVKDDGEKSSNFEDEHAKDGENHSSHPKVTKLQADAMDEFRLPIDKVDVVKMEQRRLESVNAIGVFVSDKLLVKRDSIILLETKPSGILIEPHHTQARKSEPSSSLLTDKVSDHASLKSLGDGAESPSDTLLLEDSRQVKLGILALLTVGSCIYPKQGSPGKKKIRPLDYSATIKQWDPRKLYYSGSYNM